MWAATINRESKNTLAVITKWILIALITGASSATIVASFLFALNWVAASTPLLVPKAPFLLPIIGALIVGLLFLRRVPDSGGEGIPEYIIMVNKGSGMSSEFTGPLIIIGLGSGALLASLVGFGPGSPEYYVFLACGMSATLGAALNIPIAAIIITIKIFGVAYVLPAIVSGILAFLIYKAKTIYTLHLQAATSATDDL